MRRKMAGLLVVSLMMSLIACGSGSSTASDTAPANNAEVSSEATDNQSTEKETSAAVKPEDDKKDTLLEKPESQPEETPAAGPEVTFEPFTPIDNDECLVTIKELDPDNAWGYTIKVGLENKSSDKTYMFSVSTASVNGVEDDPFFAAEVAPGKKANDSIIFSSDTLKKNGITDFTDIELDFRVYDSDDWSADDVVNESFHIYPYGEDKATAFVREQQESDQILVDNDAATVVVTSKEKDSIWGYTLNLFIVNKADKEIMISADDATINGYMADPFFATSVQSGKCAFTSMSWSDSTLEENDITDIEEIEFKLRGYDPNNWDADDFFNEVVVVQP